MDLPRPAEFSKSKACLFPVTAHTAFTLIELAIVLVIIGLVIGGVLVGRSLIEAATVQKQLRQIGSFNAAALTFKLKFNGLPGDLPAPGNYGLFTPSGSGGAGLGNNDGYITSAGVTASSTINGAQFTGEVMLFWRHLSEAGLIEGNYADDIIAGAPYGTVGTSFPHTVLSSDLGLVLITGGDIGSGVGGMTAVPGNTHFYYLGAQTSTSDTARYGSYQPLHTGQEGAFLPTTAKMLDEKMDDGKPLLGKVQIRHAGGGYNTNQIWPGTWWWNDSFDAYSCVAGGSATSNRDSAQYNTNSVTRTCEIKVIAGF